MPNKLNLSAVEKYAKAFAGKICDDFFAQNNSIEGKQILSLSSIQQVNLLTIKALFEKWQGETQRLRSPYFNYESTAVQDALKNFMNTVSQYISVKREHFEPLLIDATAETLVLATEPDIYFKEAMRDLPGFRLTTESLKGLSKYVQINKGILEKLGDKLGSQEYVFANLAMTWVEEICAKSELEDSEKYLDQFAQVVPLSDELLGKETIVETPVSTAPVSFFDQELTTIVKAKEPEPIVQAKIEFPKIEEPVIEPPRIEPVAVQPIIERPIEVVRAAVVEAVVPEVKAKEVEDQRLNDKFNNSETLNDKVTHSEKTLLDVHQSTKIGDITSAISLNQRFLFTNNLFAGNIQAFNHALEELELCKDFGEAKELLLKKYVPKYLWDITSAEAEEFIDIIKRRFN